MVKKIIVTRIQTDKGKAAYLRKKLRGFSRFMKESFVRPAF